MSSTIILSDNGVSSGSAGLKSTAGNDGVLILQTTTSSGTATNAVYVDNTQDVGIGTNAPVANTRLHVHDAVNTASRIRLTNATTTDASGKGLGIFQNGVDTYFTNNEVGAQVFSTSGTERMRILAGAPILCLAGGNTSATGTGIAFPATQSASTDANTLDDYEEGTFTPTVLGTGSNPTVSYHGNNGGRYIKIGKMVYLQVYLRWLSLTGGSGNMLVGGLPYAAAVSTQAIGLSGVTEWSGSYPVSAAYPTPSFESGIGLTSLYGLRSGTGVSSINQALSGLPNSDTYILFGFCYEASA